MFLFTRTARTACAYLSPPTRRLLLTGRIGGGNRTRRKIRTRRVCRDRSQATFRRRNARGVSVAQRRSRGRTCRVRSKLVRFLQRTHKTRRVRTVLAVVLCSLLRLLPLPAPLRVSWMKIMMRVSPMHSSSYRSLRVRQCTRLRCQMAAGIQRHLHGQ